MLRAWLWIAVFFSNFLLAQKGSTFPGLSGHALDGTRIRLPFGNDKYTVVGIAYSRKAEGELKPWLEPMYSLFIRKEEGGGFDLAELYDVNFVFIPMISGFGKVAAEFKKGTDKEFWPYIMDAEGTDIEKVQQSLKVKDDERPYFYVLDKSGKIVAVESGAYTPAKLENIEDAVE